MVQNENNPFVADEPTTTKGEDMLEAEVVKETEVTMKVLNNSSYPYINKDGDIKIGLAIVLEDATDDSPFGDAGDNAEKSMVIFDSETQAAIIKEVSFSMESLSKKMKVISEEVFTNLSNVRKKVTLMKAYKNLKNSNYSKMTMLPIHEDEARIVQREIKKNAELSKNLLSKISEATGSDLEGMLTAYQFKKHLLITGDAGLYQSLLCA